MAQYQMIFQIFIKKNNEVFSIYVKVPKNIRIQRLIEREKLDIDIAEKEINIKDNIKIDCGLDIIVSRCNVIINGERKFDSVVDETINWIEKLNQQ